MSGISINLLTYLLQASLCLILFIGFYNLLIAKLTFFSWNRFYLMCTALLSMLIPFMHLDYLQFKNIAINQRVYHIPQWEMGSFVAQTTMSINSATPSASPALVILLILILVYSTITLYKLYKLLADIYSVCDLIRSYAHHLHHKLQVIYIKDEVPTSSFFNYIFINQAQQNSPWLHTILAHEESHCRNLHSLDYLFIKFLGAIFWFNPAIHWWQKAVRDNHEYLADQQVTYNTDPVSYSLLLVEVASQKHIHSTLHSFSYGQLKSRITMLHQTRSNSIHKLRFLVVAPLIAMLLTIVSCQDNLKDDIIVSSNSNAGYHSKSLIGTWSTVNQVTVNQDDGKKHRIFPHQVGDLRILSSRLVLTADGHFQMLDEKINRKWSGIWQSNEKGTSLVLHFDEPMPSDASSSLAGRITLEITSLKGASMEALQSYGVSEEWSAGQVYYAFERQ